MKRLPLTLIATTALVAGAASTPAAAGADTLLAPAPGAQHLAAGGGYHAWMAPSGGAWKLTLRAPDGTVTTPAIAAFAQPGQLTIGSLIDNAFARELVVVYARADGDLHAYDLRTARESRLTSTRGVRESAPALVEGSLAFVRRGGTRPGIYVSTRMRAAKRIAADTPSILANNRSRVAYPKGRSIVVRRMSGRGPLVFRTRSVPQSLALTRYRVAWLEGDRAYQTPRFAGSGGPYDVRAADEAKRTVPGAVSLVMESGNANVFLDAEGMKRAVPPLF